MGVMVKMYGEWHCLATNEEADAFQKQAINWYFEEAYQFI